MSNIQKIEIDGNLVVEWEIYEYYDLYLGEIKQRACGHSDYRYPKKSNDLQAFIFFIYCVYQVDSF